MSHDFFLMFSNIAITQAIIKNPPSIKNAVTTILKSIRFVSEESGLKQSTFGVFFHFEMILFSTPF